MEVRVALTGTTVRLWEGSLDIIPRVGEHIFLKGKGALRVTEVKHMFDTRSIVIFAYWV